MGSREDRRDSRIGSHDVAKLRALSIDPAIAAQAASRFPAESDLVERVRVNIELELLLAEREVLLIDGSPTPEQLAVLDRKCDEQCEALDD